MSAVDNVSSSFITSFVEKAKTSADICGRTFSKSSGGLEKFCKLVNPIINLVHVIFGEFACLANFKIFTQSYAELYGALNSLERVKDWTDWTTKCISEYRVFGKSEKNFVGVIKCIKNNAGISFFRKNVLLTLGNICETVLYGHKMGLYNIGRFALSTCRFSIFRYFPGALLWNHIFIGTACIVGVIENNRKIADFEKNSCPYSELQIKKWEAKLKLLEQKVQIKKTLAKEEIRRCEESILRHKLDYTQFRQDVKTYQPVIKQKTYDQICQKIDGISQAIDQKIENNPDQQADIDNAIIWRKYKVEYWKARNEEAKHEIYKAKVTIISEVFKFIVIALANIALVISFGTLLQVTLLSCAIILGAAGYQKFIIDVKKEMPKKPDVNNFLREIPA